MLIPVENEIKDGKIADGMVEKECRFCHTKFAVPEADAAKYTNVCEGCKDALDKEVGAATATLMKDTAAASEAIKKALGD